MKSRIIKNRLLYTKYILNGRKDILRRILDKSIEDKNSWWKVSLKYMKEVRVKLGEIEYRKKEEIAKKIRSWNTERWKTDMEGKECLIIYRTWKKEVKEEQIYDNRYSSVLPLKARTDTLPLNYKNRHTGGI